MTVPPERPLLYHITHVENLASIIADGALLSDRLMLGRSGPSTAIGLSGIKKRRLEELIVHCHSGTHVGDYVPFYFCPRSVMLFVITKRNHPELTYRGGDEGIVHLEADLASVVEWADKQQIRWALSNGNAGAAYTDFYSRLSDLAVLDWTAIASTDFRDPDVKLAKQSEFLIHDRFPFDLVRRIGVKLDATGSRAAAAVSIGHHRPPVEVRRDWYF